MAFQQTQTHPDGTGDDKTIVETEHVDRVTPDDAETGKRPVRSTANNQLDDAARLLREAGGIEVTLEENKRVLRRIDLFVCVPMCIVYWLQQLDKVRQAFSGGNISLTGDSLL